MDAGAAFEEECVEVVRSIPRRLETIQAFKQQGGAVAAVLPIHYPRALLRAFDILPVEVWGPPGVDVSSGAAHLQPYVCSIVRNSLSYIKSGGLDITDLLIVPHACDSLQGFGSVLIDFIQPDKPVLPIYIPRDRRSSDVGFFADELRSLYHNLADITGRAPADSHLLQCIHREEEADEMLSLLHQMRSELRLSDIEFYRIVRSREYFPAESFVELARGVKQSSAKSTRPRVPLLLSGIVPEPMGVLEAITEMGGFVVADDLASCGRRLYPPGSSQDPFQRMAERILNGPPDPTRGSPISERLEHLLKLVDESGAGGVVFYDVKFCEPELFDIPSLRSGLQELGVPSLAVEVDINDTLPHQVLTRLEAFLEMIA
jgi:benzoyl-CoA reductase/2-hydroxyglutaryl-CoA dehydratase subunit BcrC/BadD/HgdB